MVFYKLNAARVTMREFWWETKLFCWVGLLVKIFQIRLRGSSDDWAVDSLKSFQVESSAIRPEVLQRFESTLQELAVLGFGPPVWHDQENIYQATRNTLATMLHSNGRTWARVQCRTNHGRVPAKRKFFTTFISKTHGGFLATGNGKYDMAWPKTHSTMRFRKMEIGPLYAAHQKRMTASVQLVSPGQLLDVAEEYHVTLRDFHLARGVFEPLGEEELAMVAPPPVPVPAAIPMPVLAVSSDVSIGDLPTIAPPPLPKTSPPPPPPDLMEIATLDELSRLQNKKVNWRSSAILLIVSAIAFIFFFKNADRQQDWQFVAIVVGVLLFHEMGHYIAMRVFGYRNLKLFFIPGFGAAVTGRNYNAPAWKKIIVSLMGPLPGIFAGIVCLALHGFLHNQLLYLIGLLAIVINAFNLIPILPLDGGWVAHAALFSRHPKLDTGFRVVAAGLLIAISLLLPGSHFLLYIAIASLITLPMTNRLAIIVGELRAEPSLGLSPDNQSIPPQTARIILAKIRQRFKKGLNAKLAAQHIASVFESLNARPPSIGATVGLLSLHGFGFLLAIVVGLVAIGTNGRSLLRNPMGSQLKYQITSDQIITSPAVPTGPRNIVIMRFKSDTAADRELPAIANIRPATRFGQTLLVSFRRDETGNQRMFFDHYSKIADDIFVESSQMRANVQMTFKLPDTDDSKQVLEDLQAYLIQSSWKLIPPWADETDWPQPQRSTQTELRPLVKELQAPPVNASSNAERMQQLIAAQRAGDSAEADRVQAQIQQELDDSTKAQHQQLKEKFGHADFIQTWDQINTLKDFKLRNTRNLQEIVPQLGQWPDSKPNDLLVTSGYAYNLPATSPNTFSLYCIFNQTDTALPAMTRWLFAHGATGVHYQIIGTPALPDDGSGDEN